MNRKLILILCDGMRSDSLEACGHPMATWMQEHSLHTLQAHTVMPSITLPCIMSLCYSAQPERHGIFTLQYAQPLKPVEGIFEHLARHGKQCTFYYDWEELSDLCRPGAVGEGTLTASVFLSGGRFGYSRCDAENTETMLRDTARYQPDFVFLYLGDPDHQGHTEGWMSRPYLDSVSRCWDLIEAVHTRLGSAYTLLVTADHGGHAHTHGEPIPEDMTIPIFCIGDGIPGAELKSASILDIAPTIASALQVPASPLWDGKALF